MIKRTLILLFSVLVLTPLRADEAKELLNKLSKHVNTLASVYIEYTITTENKQQNTRSIESGKVLSEKNKFKLQTKGLEVYCDGLTQWMFLVAEQEVTISKANANSDDIFSNPIRFLTGQRKDFKYKYKGEIEHAGKILSEIDYYPKDLKAAYSIVRMHVDIQKMQVHSLQYFGKDGVQYTVQLTKYLPNVKDYTPQDFVFNADSFPNLEVVDLR